MSTLGNNPRNRLRRAIVSLLVGVFVATIGALGAWAVPPANDECAGALAVTPGGAGVATSNLEATSFPDDPVLSCTMGPGFGSVFFTFVATAASALVRTDVGSAGLDADFAVYAVNQADQCNTQLWGEVGCNEDNTITLARNTSTCIEGLVVDETYKIVLMSFTAGSSGDYTLQVGGPCGDSVSAVCGDGVVEGSEQCDDGNTTSLDGCSDICEIEVVVDTTPPVFTTVPGDQNVNTDAGLPTAVVSFPDATATDDSSSVTVTRIAGLASGSAFPVGPTLVTFEAEDPSGNTAQASFTVTVTDNEDPVISVPGDINAEATSAAGAVVEFPFATATDNVGVVSVTRIVGPASGLTFPLGPTMVTFEAADAAGNTAQGSFTVTVTDTTAPLITAPANVIVETGAPPPVSVAIGTATATDAVDPAPEITNNAPTFFPLGLTVVTWRATDASGNYAEANQDVTVMEPAPADTTPPVVTPPADINAEATSAAGAVVVFPDATATDNVGVVSLDQTAGPASDSVFPIGLTEVTWTATDAAGNVGTATQNVTVVYIFGQFLPPLEDGKIYKANRTITVKFQIFYVGGEPAEEAVVGIQVDLIGEGDTLGELIVLSTNETADSGSVFRFTDGQYIYNLSTRGFVPGMYRITAILSNGQAPFIDIGLR